MIRSRNAIKDALLHHKIDNEVLADTLVKYAMHMMLRGTAEYLRRNGFPEAADFLASDVAGHLDEIDGMHLDFTEQEPGPQI